MVRAFSWLVSGNNGFSLCGVLFRVALRCVALRSMIDYIIFATPHRATINRLMTTLYITKIAENPMQQRLETLATANYPYEKPNYLGARNHRASRAPTRTHSLTVSSLHVPDIRFSTDNSAFRIARQRCKDCRRPRRSALCRTTIGKHRGTKRRALPVVFLRDAGWPKKAGRRKDFLRRNNNHDFFPSLSLERERTPQTPSSFGAVTQFP
mmetsp:Transcript_6702/g.16048  ORF Transcript_6702/g.16048 Transcript_6702/m.16048 type:complete len:210 (+) Transcript_6702:478-1107(+)